MMTRAAMNILRIRIGKALFWALAAVLLLVGALPPALVHTHPGWGHSGPHHAVGANHSHDVSESDGGHAHGRPHGHHQHFDSDLARAAAEVADADPHRHVSWFGFEVTWPLPVEHGSSDESLHGQSEVYVQMIDDNWSFGQSPMAAVAFFAPNAGGAAAEWLVSLNRVGFICNSAESHFLCDSARHERSGVQLI